MTWENTFSVCQNSASPLLTVLYWLSFSSFSKPLDPPPLQLPPPPHIRCAYEHQNAIRPSRTPLVPWPVGLHTEVVHSEPRELWLLLTDGPQLRPLWENKTPKEPFWRKNVEKWKTDGTTGADNTRQSTIMQHLATVEGCNCLRQGRGMGVEVEGAEVACWPLMEWCHMKTPEWQLVNRGGLADQIKCINSRKWPSSKWPHLMR